MSAAGQLSLVGGSLAFDFANTASGRGLPTGVDHIRSPFDLLDWAGHAGVVDAATAGRIRDAFSADPAEAKRVLARVLGLREAIYRVGTAIARKADPAGDDFHAITAAAGSAMASGRLGPAGEGGYRFDFREAPPEHAIAGPLALSMIDLLAAADLARVKQCPGHGPGNECQWLFLDVSKNNSRRWCDMATCGNRSKSKRHRERRGAQTPPRQ